jgi:hypothetical protein
LPNEKWKKSIHNAWRSIDTRPLWDSWRGSCGFNVEWNNRDVFWRCAYTKLYYPEITLIFNRIMRLDAQGEKKANLSKQIKGPTCWVAAWGWGRPRVAGQSASGGFRAPSAARSVETNCACSRAVAKLLCFGSRLRLHSQLLALPGGKLKMPVIRTNKNDIWCLWHQITHKKWQSKHFIRLYKLASS